MPKAISDPRLSERYLSELKENSGRKSKDSCKGMSNKYSIPVSPAAKTKVPLSL